MKEIAGLADVERDLIRTRTAEGRSRAKTQGKQMGPTLTGTAEGRHQTARLGRYAARIGEELQSWDINYARRHARLTRSCFYHPR